MRGYPLWSGVASNYPFAAEQLTVSAIAVSPRDTGLLGRVIESLVTSASRCVICAN
jgi:hypothetical protein